MECENISIIVSEPDVVIRTSNGLKIPAFSGALVSASPVFEEIVERRRRKGRLDKAVPILGVPSDAVLAFVGFLCSPRSESLDQNEVMDKYGMHLMVLSHVYRVKWLKDLCEVELALRLTVDSVVDVLQLARQCDVPKLYLQCMKLLNKEFAAVEKTEGWVFLQNNDPWFELEILKFLEEEDLIQKRRKRKMEEQQVYLQLSEAMECLQHICTEGCTDVGPNEAEEAPNKQKSLSCPNYTTCHVLQNLIKHLASCRANRSACSQCRRIWNLLRLHSSVCQFTDDCRVPLCKQFKMKMNMEGKGENGKWRLLAKKVVSVKVMSSLAKKRKHDLLYKL
ncbi:uncharacterized protein A4U43_C04F6010 [Asparagus officinalis]|uniref:TAZ-type domain-containing protein n=1 Tax=Asparagus officinalis TaxID=4686 RepID=A0A5P1F332_ASPOF|nr:uncharacterized protein A4U43_C04F6010 [Asparagus officinalis]